MLETSKRIASHSEAIHAMQFNKSKQKTEILKFSYLSLFEFVKDWRSNLTKAVASNHASCGLYPLEVEVVVALRRTDFIDFRMAPKETIQETIHAYILKWFSNLLQPENGNHKREKHQSSTKVMHQRCRWWRAPVYTRNSTLRPKPPACRQRSLDRTLWLFPGQSDACRMVLSSGIS